MSVGVDRTIGVGQVQAGGNATVGPVTAGLAYSGEAITPQILLQVVGRLEGYVIRQVYEKAPAAQ